MSNTFRRQGFWNQWLLILRARSFPKWQLFATSKGGGHFSHTVEAIEQYGVET